VLKVGIFDPNIEKMVERQDVTSLVKVLQKNKENKFRIKAVEALGKLGDSRAVDALILTLKDSDRDVRRAAFVALRNLGDLRAMDPLIQALKDSDDYVRFAATHALGNLGDPKAVDPLTAVNVLVILLNSHLMDFIS